MLRRSILVCLVIATLCSAQNTPTKPATPTAGAAAPTVAAPTAAQPPAAVTAAGVNPAKKPPTDPAPTPAAADPTAAEPEDETAADEETLAEEEAAAAETPAAGAARKPDPALQACRKAAQNLKGEILLNEVFPVKVSKAWDLQDPSTSPLLKEVMAEYGVQDFQATNWRKDLQGNVRRRITYQVELAGFVLEITERNLILPETSKDKCYSVLRTITVKGMAAKTQLSIGQNVKAEVNTMFFSTPDGQKTRAVAALRVTGLSELEQSLYDSIGKEKINEVIQSVKTKLNALIKKDAVATKP